MRYPAMVFYAVAAAALPAAAAERPWVEVRTPHFTVVSNAGDGEARDFAFQFEQVRFVFQKLWPWGRLQTGRPFVVIVARGEKDLRALAPQYWQGPGFRPASVYGWSAAADYVALRTDVDRRDEINLNPYAGAFEGFASIVIGASFPRDVPLWFRNGLQELIGNTLVRKDDVHVGRVIPYHLERLAGSPTLPLRSLLEATTATVDMRDESTRRAFDAQSWAFVHYLVFGEEQANLRRLNRLVDLILEGRTQAAALQEVFGDLSAVEAGFRQYLTRRMYAYSKVNADLNVSKQGFTTRPLTPAESAAVRAGFLAAVDRPAEARALLAEARAANPSLAAAYEVEGLLLDREDKDGEAKAAFARAIALGSESYYVHYRHASLAWPGGGGGDFAPVVRDLEAAVRLSPDYAPAAAWLAHARIGAGQAQAAIGPARRAVALEPNRHLGHHALARAFAHSGRHAEALASVERAIARAADARERAESEELKAWIVARGAGSAPPQKE